MLQMALHDHSLQSFTKYIVKDCLKFEKIYEGFGLCFFDMFMMSVLPN